MPTNSFQNNHQPEGGGWEDNDEGGAYGRSRIESHSTATTARPRHRYGSNPSIYSTMSDAETLIVGQSATRTDSYVPASDHDEGRKIMIAIKPHRGFDDSIYLTPEEKSQQLGSYPIHNNGASSHALASQAATPSVIPHNMSSSHPSSSNTLYNQQQQQQRHHHHHQTAVLYSASQLGFEQAIRHSPNHYAIKWAISNFRMNPSRDTIILVHSRNNVMGSKTKWLDSSVVAAAKIYDTEERLRSIELLSHYAKYVTDCLGYQRCRALTLFGSDWRMEILDKANAECVDALCLIWRPKHHQRLSKLGAKFSIGMRGIDQ
ncbi:hypothetical protein EV182_003584, partial [Spiromyces aspiralis]